MKYECADCGKEVEHTEMRRVRCPYCGSKILKKKEREEIKKVKAR